MFTKTRTCIGVALLVVISTASAWQGMTEQEVERIRYSSEGYNKYRDIKYWGECSIGVRDYSYGSGDAEYLKLISKGPAGSIDTVTAKELVAHFNTECQRLLTNRRPINNVTELRKKVRDEFIQEHLAKRDFSPESLQEFVATEEAKVRAEFGPNPGMVHCSVGISRRTFPVLYEMKSTLYPELNTRNELVQQQKLGYSTPEDITKELKRSITEQLEALSKELATIDRYSSR